MGRPAIVIDVKSEQGQAVIAAAVEKAVKAERKRLLAIAKDTIVSETSGLSDKTTIKLFKAFGAVLKDALSAEA